MNRKSILPVVFHALGAALLFLLASFWLHRPVWMASKPLVLLVAMFAGVYFLAGVALTWARPLAGRDGLVRVLLVGTACFGVAYMAQAFSVWSWPDTFDVEVPHAATLAMTGVGLALLVAARVAGVAGRGLSWLLAALLLATIATAWLAAGERAVPRQQRQVAYLDSSLHVLKTTAYRRWIADGSWRGGAIAAAEEGYVLASGRGLLYFLTEDEGKGALNVRALAYQVPFNPDEFSDAGRRAFADEWNDDDHGERLRVADIQVQPREGSRWRVFVSHHYWREGEKCFVVRVSVLEGSRREILEGDGLAWRTVYESAPCLTLNVHGHRGGRFGGYQIGGAMALIGENELLVAVGDHEFDGWNRAPSLPQDPASPYGKILRVQLDSGKSEVYSLGHRNPQGLFLDASGNLWETEHGPRGGDELNLVRPGANYGWPLATYGTEYWLHHWPLARRAGWHDDFEKPVLAFVPSIALSSLTGVSGKLFPAWDGDLLLVSLSGDLKRVRIDDGRATVVEPLVIGGRIRDVVQGSDGRIVLLTDAQAIIFVEPADSDSPEALVFQCAGCHTFSKWERASIGPNLWRVFGRKVGRDAGFEYSQSMRDFGGRWTRERLDQFLADPAETVPGTTMQFAGMKDPAQRAKLIQYLKEQR